MPGSGKKHSSQKEWPPVAPPQLTGSEERTLTTQKLDPPLTHKEAYDRIQNYLFAWEILDITGSIVLEAARGVQTYMMTYWDAQIWAAARLNQVKIIFTEDFNIGAAIEGVRFINPLAEDFNLESWV